MTDSKELATLTAAEMDDIYLRNVPATILEQYATRLIAAYTEGQEPVAWDGSEGWEQLAWNLCAEEGGEESCTELLWDGGPIPEPWGDRWLKYEGEAKRMISLVRKFTAPPAPRPSYTGTCANLHETVQVPNAACAAPSSEALISESADALESLEQQVAALQSQMYEDRRQALVWRDQVAALTEEREEFMRDYRRILIERGEQANIASAAQEREAKLRKQLQRVIGCHNPPNDCYSTGPLMGNEFVDLVSCPSCEAEALLALPTDDSALTERLKEERERMYVEMFNQGYINKQSLQQLQGA